MRIGTDQHGEQSPTTSPTTHELPDRQLPRVLDLVDAAAILGIGRTTAYKLVSEGAWPTPVLRIGRLIKIPALPWPDPATKTPLTRSSSAPAYLGGARCSSSEHLHTSTSCGTQGTEHLSVGPPHRGASASTRR